MKIDAMLLYDWIIVLWYVVFLAFFVIIYFLNTKPYKSKFQKTTIEQYPSKLKPVELSMLMYKKITPEVFTTSILSLIHHKIITITKIKDDYILELKDNESINIEKAQEYIIDILFNSIAKDKKLSLSTLEKYALNKGNGSEFLTNYYVWKRIAQRETFNKKFYEPKTGYNLIVIYRIITIVLVSINFLTKHNSIMAYLLIFLSLILKYFFYRTYKRTNEFNDEYHKWVGFQNHLKSFSSESIEQSDEQIFDGLSYRLILKTYKNMQNQNFDGMDEFGIKLNNVVNRCVINAELYAHRKIKWK